MRPDLRRMRPDSRRMRPDLRRMRPDFRRKRPDFRRKRPDFRRTCRELCRKWPDLQDAATMGGHGAVTSILRSVLLWKSWVAARARDLSHLFFYPRNSRFPKARTPIMLPPTGRANTSGAVRMSFGQAPRAFQWVLTSKP